MKNKIYVIMENMYDWGDVCQELKDNKFFKSKQEAIDYADKTIYPKHRESCKESLEEEYYDNQEGDLFMEEEEKGLPHYQPTEKEIFKDFKNSEYYEIKELEEF